MEDNNEVKAADDSKGGSSPDQDTEMTGNESGNQGVESSLDKELNAKRGYNPRRGGRGGGKMGNNYRHRNQRRHAPYRQRKSDDQGDQEGSNEKNLRVYVGNLSWDVNWRDLKDHMKSTGCEVTRADVITTADGRSKGCGIVEFATSEGARRAVLTLNDTELNGRQIFVREDREEKQASGGDSSNNRGQSGDAQSRRCYVGNLSWDVAWQDLKDHMREAGDVVFAEVMTENDGRSKGCGIVEYATAEEAREAIQSLTDTELKGRMIFVREDRETSGGGGGNPRQSCSVYVGNLAFETSWQDLKDHMRQAGNVDQANIMSSDDGRSKGCGLVLYQKPQDAARAIRELQNSELHGRPIFVREDREQGHSGGSSGGSGGTQLFVGNLSWDTTWKELKDHFRQCGDVERSEVMEGPAGRSKGFGTVRFYRAKDAQNAIRRLNGVELQGRNLEVRLDNRAN